MTVTARFDGRVFVPDGPVDLPVGQPVRIVVEPASPPPPADPADVLARVLAIAAKANVTGEVETTARDHDRVLYGGPGGAR